MKIAKVYLAFTPYKILTIRYHSNLFLCFTCYYNNYYYINTMLIYKVHLTYGSSSMMSYDIVLLWP